MKIFGTITWWAGVLIASLFWIRHVRTGPYFYHCSSSAELHGSQVRDVAIALVIEVAAREAVFQASPCLMHIADDEGSTLQGSFPKHDVVS